MKNGLIAFAAALSLTSGANASRVCSTPTYQWRVGAARFDGADPSKNNGLATVAVSIVPGTRAQGTFFECVAEWPESWEGRYEDGNIIWSDCIWAGNGATYDTAVAFALDWKNRTMHVSHTFDCSDASGSSALATGSLVLGMGCTTTEESGTSCALNETSPAITTKGSRAHLGAGSSCADNSKTYQSWQLEEWHRQYILAPGSTASPSSDTGPSFTLRNMANADVFDCSPSTNQNDTFEGTCKSRAEGSSTTAAAFRFERSLGILTITQSWDCGDSSSFDAVGVAYVQGSCSREGDLLTCTSLPLWIGTQTP
ncbi:hypothetical protein GGS23DRAFT_539438 [Durotheca rogersii]|uniref:uncharacterized protein n=1 Tax=Durotheca rogersii TaxID=419775 RepID=UPI00221F1934|nr:uncharacterized protein GGS23DRAFT_539438 [Durotheca rogersii]KAI5863553.1 hypothetical protein GGS23DRAFT_539438 [Durotheca rogersii]